MLIIDDDAAIVQALTLRLSASGHDVHSASNGQSGLAVAKSICPDVIVLDIRMPGMDGLEVGRRIKADPVLGNTPLIFLSANLQGQTKRDALGLGATACISKPYDSRQLIAAVELAIASRECR